MQFTAYLKTYSANVRDFRRRSVLLLLLLLWLALMAPATAIAFEVKDNRTDSNGKLTSAVQSRTVTITPMPTVTALSRTSEWSNGATVIWDLTFDTAPTIVLPTSFTLVPSAGISGAAIGSVTGNGKSWVVIATTGTGDGTLGLNLTNTAGVTPKATDTFPGEVYFIDKTVPSIQIGNPSTSITEGGPVTYTVTYADDHFSAITLTAADITLTAADITLNPTGTATGTVSVDAGTGSTRTVTISNITGDGTLGITIAAGTAADLAKNAAPEAASATFKVDNAAPTVTIGAPSASATKGGPVTYTVTYTDTHFDASTLTAADITLNPTGTATGIVTVDAGTGSTRTVTISNITGDGTLGISIAAGTAADQAGHLAGAAGPSTTFVVDNTAPTVTLGAPSAGITRGGPITYTVTYADDHFNISTLGVAGITLHQTGSADGTVSVSPGSGNSRTVTISNITGNGTLGISLAAGTAVDQAGNTSGAAGPSVTFVVDNTAPTVTLSAPSADITKGGLIAYTVTYADANLSASTLTPAEIILNRTGSADGTVAVDAGNGSNRTVSISNITGDGTLAISLAAGTAVDQVGNTAPAAGPSATFIVDNTAPTVQISAPSATLTKGGPATYTVTYTDDNFSASTLTPADVSLNKSGTANGTVTVDAGSGSSRTVSISNITGNGTLGISIAAGTAVDQAGNTVPAAGPSATFVVDNTAPTITISKPSVSRHTGSITYTVAYADANFSASTLTAGNIILNRTGSANGTVSVDAATGNTRIVTINDLSGSGTIGISIQAGTAADAAGNLAAAAGPSTSFLVCAGDSLTVTNANDSGAGSLRQAMADICPGGTIDFGITGTITLTSGALVPVWDVTIAGPESGSLIVSGNEANRVLEIAGSTQVDLYNITVANGAAEAGGGILNQGDLLLGNVTISGNRGLGTDGLGGGIFNAGNLTVTNSTLADNSAPEGTGGAIYNSGSLTLISSTLSGNSDAGGAGGIYHLAGRVVIANSILAGNGTNCQGTLIDDGNNLEDGASCGFNASTSMSDIDPRLDPAGLRDHGGPTRTIALLAGSPAVDAGNEMICPATDQRGTDRPQGSGCDIGAYEIIPTTTTTVNSSNSTSAYGTLVTFTATVNDNEIASSPGGTVTFRAGTDIIGTGTLDTSAQASFAISSLSAGAHSITAAYAGDGSFTGSTSPAITQKVDKAP